VTRFDFHPEDLLERESRGTASAAERARLTQHLAECTVCRVERALAREAAHDAAPRRDEELLVARLKRDVSARATSHAGRRSRQKRAMVAVALLAGTLASVAAAATYVIVRGAGTPPSVVVAKASERSRKAGPPQNLGPEKPEAPRVAPADEAEAAAPNASESESEVSRRAAPAAAEPASSSELFSRANQARRDGKVTEAVRLYRALQERFSGTNEELVSRVTLGRLLLDRMGDSRGALVQFNSYLASPGGGVLREEAMVGRALALGRMGRAAEERAAWQALLDGFPKSTQRKRAEARLAELGRAGDGAARAGSGAGRTGGAK
jgi:TolA-binding protein